MLRNTHSFLLLAVSLAIPIGSLVVAGCSKGEAPSETPGTPADAPRMGGSGGPGGPGGPGGGRMGGGPIAANATGAEIFGAKCAGCHGDKGQGARGPSLMKAAAAPDDALFKTVHDGKGRMPSFSSQMTDAQIKEVVAYVKNFGA